MASPQPYDEGVPNSVHFFIMSTDRGEGGNEYLLIYISKRELKQTGNGWVTWGQISCRRKNHL
jgi:hypothetical protein